MSDTLFDAILRLDCPELLIELSALLSNKVASAQTMSLVEREIYLVLSLLPVLEMDGILSLFGELCGLDDTRILESALRKMGRARLADLFAEAKGIYACGRSDLTADAYHALDPFASPDRLDQLRLLEARMLEPGSEIYGDEALCAYVRAQAAALAGRQTA